MCGCLALLDDTMHDLDQIGHNKTFLIQCSPSNSKPCIDFQVK